MVSPNVLPKEFPGEHAFLVGVFAEVEPAGLQHPGDALQHVLMHEILQHDAMALRELLLLRNPPVVLDDARAAGRELDHAASGTNVTPTESRAAAKSPGTPATGVTSCT